MSEEHHEEHHEETTRTEGNEEQTLDRAFGQMEERVTNLITDLGNHSEKLLNVENDLGQVKEQLNSWAGRIAEIPSAEERANLEQRLNDLAGQLAEIPNKLTQSLTQAPPRAKREKRNNGEFQSKLKRLF